MKTIIVVLLALVTCAGCRDETTGTNQVQQDFAPNSKSDERVIAIECEITNMPQKLEGKGWSTMHWGIDLANSIMALDDRDERCRLINKCLDAMSHLVSALNVRQDASHAFRNYELLIDASTILAKEPEITERVLGIICECVHLHRREVKKWSDAIKNEPNRRARTPMKNIHGCLNSYFMVFTNRIERDYFPWMKAHGLPPDRHEHWRRQLDAAYEMKEAK